ncbi:hypothetical protein DCAR_0101479 [Daucus carota subsp. sativus]|uniref:Uncharacterized protein n=1 Tax=Daucus carota subsp. sativus TaxID=79200 RepID=A0A162AGS0_DAUCS|nr:hypothetical protein DCAR_0101479 [Daucus carota subsp. sativus]
MPDSLICNKCAHNNILIPMYMVKAEVKDSTSETTFTLFERHVLKLINVSAQHVLNNDKNASPDVVPAVLNNIFGRKYVFKLSITRKNTIERYKGYIVIEVEEIANEQSSSASLQIVDPTHKRKPPAQEENFPISNDEVGKVCRGTTDNRINDSYTSTSTQNQLSDGNAPNITKRHKLE